MGSDDLCNRYNFLSTAFKLSSVIGPKWESTDTFANLNLGDNEPASLTLDVVAKSQFQDNFLPGEHGSNESKTKKIAKILIPFNV